MAYGQEIIEIAGLYILGFLIIGTMVFYRNYLLQVFNKFILKHFYINFNNLNFSNYFSFFYNGLKKLKSFFFK